MRPWRTFRNCIKQLSYAFVELGYCHKTTLVPFAKLPKAFSDESDVFWSYIGFLINKNIYFFVKKNETTYVCPSLLDPNVIVPHLNILFLASFLLLPP